MTHSVFPPPYDVIIKIFRWLDDDYKTLYRCSLVSREFSEAAARILYRDVHYRGEYNFGKPPLVQYDPFMVRILFVTQWLRMTDTFCCKYSKDFLLPHDCRTTHHLYDASSAQVGEPVTRSYASADVHANE